jgi:hypothetical protein
LAISVFAWGLQYKLSLYDPPHSSSHEMPEAKLLSRNEQATAVEGFFESSTKAWPVIAQILPFGLLALTFLGLSSRVMPIFHHFRREAKRPWRLSCRPCLNAFFFRPPPSLTWLLS